MFEKPDFPDLLIITRLQAKFRLDVIDRYFVSSVLSVNVAEALFLTGQLSGGR